MKNQETIIRKIGQNRGRSRVWLEGAYLTQANWVRGVAYDAVFNAKAGLITLIKGGSGSRKVCGKAGKHPIIDVCNQQVADVLAPEGYAEIEVTEDEILISLGRRDDRNTTFN